MTMVMVTVIMTRGQVTRGAVGVLQSGLELALVFIIDSDNDKGTGDPGDSRGPAKWFRARSSFHY